MALQIPRLLRLGGADKLTFVGGEPLMHPHIDQLITEAKAAGLTTALVTNGACLNAERLLRLKGAPTLCVAAVVSPCQKCTGPHSQIRPQE